MCKNSYMLTSHTYGSLVKTRVGWQMTSLKQQLFTDRWFSCESCILSGESSECIGRINSSFVPSSAPVYIHKAVISKLVSRPKGASHRGILLEDAAWIFVEDTAEKIIHLLATFMILFNRNCGCKIFPEFLTALHHTILKRCEINNKKNKWVIYFLTNRHSSFPQ